MYLIADSQEELAEKMGISVTQVCRLAKRWDLHRQRGGRKEEAIKMSLTKEEFSDIYFSTGRSQRETAERLNVSVGCVGWWARHWGLCRIHKKMPLTKEQLKEMYVTKGMGLKEIGRELRMSKNGVHSWVKKYGLQLSRTETIRRVNVLRGCTGEYSSTTGYVMQYVPDHPNARGQCLEQHRIVAEKMLGRIIRKEETVHHINMIRNDNREENLAVFQARADHSNTHVYYQHFGLYCLGLIEKPLPLRYHKPVLWGGKWIDALDLSVDQEILCQRASGI